MKQGFFTEFGWSAECAIGCRTTQFLHYSMHNATVMCSQNDNKFHGSQIFNSMRAAKKMDVAEPNQILAENLASMCSAISLPNIFYTAKARTKNYNKSGFVPRIVYYLKG